MKNLKINIDDTVRVKISEGVYKIVLVTLVSQTTFKCVDVNEKEYTFFLHDIEKVLTKQKRIPFIFEEKTIFSQPTLF